MESPKCWHSADQVINTPWSHRIAMVRCAWASERRPKNPIACAGRSADFFRRLWHGGSSNLSIGKAWLSLNCSMMIYDDTWMWHVNQLVCVASCCIQFFDFVLSRLLQFLLRLFFFLLNPALQIRILADIPVGPENIKPSYSQCRQVLDLVTGLLLGAHLSCFFFSPLSILLEMDFRF